MAGVNKVILVGHLGRDPEIRYTASGTAIANFTLATSRNWTDKQGQRQEKTQWHRVVAWEKLAELCGAHLSKGRQVYIEGELQTRDWNDKEGNKRQTTEVRAIELQFLGSKDQNTGGAPRRPAGGAGEPGRSGPGGQDSASQDYGPPPGDDDVPF